MSPRSTKIFNLQLQLCDSEREFSKSVWLFFTLKNSKSYPISLKTNLYILFVSEFNKLICLYNLLISLDLSGISRVDWITIELIEYIHTKTICNKPFNLLKTFLTNWKGHTKTKRTSNLCHIVYKYNTTYKQHINFMIFTSFPNLANKKLDHQCIFINSSSTSYNFMHFASSNLWTKVTYANNMVEYKFEHTSNFQPLVHKELTPWPFISNHS